MLMKAGREHEGRKDLPNHTGNGIQVENGKGDGFNNCKVRPV